MRQICPHCQQSVTIPDSEAGKKTACPACQQLFDIPAAFAATVFEPPPIAPVPVPAPPATPAPEPLQPPAAAVSPEAPAPSTATPTSEQPSTSVAVATPAGYSRTCSIALSRVACHWLTPVCLTIILLLTFFNWVGMYPAGYAAYTQNGWQALVADLSADPVSERVFEKEQELNNWLRPSLWLLPYMILLILGVLIAWGEPIARRSKFKLPPIFETIWRLRPAILAACAGITLFFVLIQCAAGFGVERALNNMVQDQVREARKEAKTPEEIQRVEMKAAAITGSFNMRTTFWLKLLIALHAIVLLAIIGETVLIHRGDKPPPRIGVMW